MKALENVVLLEQAFQLSTYSLYNSFSHQKYLNSIYSVMILVANYYFVGYFSSSFAVMGINYKNEQSTII